MSDEYRKIYHVLPLADIQRLEPSRVRTTAGIPPTEVAIPPIQFGRSNPPDFAIREWPPDNWFETTYSIPDGFTYEMTDAVVHGAIGIVTLDDYLVRESLHLALPEMHGFGSMNSDRLSLPDRAVQRRIERATHALCGYVGNRNYAHWLVDIMPVIGHGLQAPADSTAWFLLPFIRTSYQRQFLDLVPEIADRVVLAEENAKIPCDLLRLTPRIMTSDYTPHPQRMAFMAELKRRAQARDEPQRKLYITRRDARRRPLANSPDIETVMRRHGYDILTNSEMSVREQICLYAQASHIVSAHGAGLANMLFCRADTPMLEFHYDRNINWSMRRLAAIVPMRYGCLVGRQRQLVDGDPVPKNEQFHPWTLPVDELDLALEQMQ